MHKFEYNINFMIKIFLLALTSKFPKIFILTFGKSSCVFYLLLVDLVVSPSFWDAIDQ